MQALGASRHIAGSHSHTSLLSISDQICMQQSQLAYLPCTDYFWDISCYYWRWPQSTKHKVPGVEFFSPGCKCFSACP